MLFLGLIPFSCEKEQQYPYIVMSGFDLTMLHLGQPYQYDDEIKPGDSLAFYLDPTHRYTAETSLLSFQSTALAQQERGYKGVKHTLDSIQIFANYPHHGSKPDQNIVDSFYGWYKVGDDWRKGEVSDLIKNINQSQLDYHSGLLTLKEYPDSSIYSNVFTIRFFVGEVDWFERRTYSLIFKK